MGGFFHYLWAQIKRIRRLLPALQIGTMLLILCMGMGVWLLMKNGNYEKRQTRYAVGLVGNTADSYLGFGIQAITSLDISRYVMDFRILTQEEADRGLKEGKLSFYARIPDDLVESLVYGRNDRSIDLVTADGEGMLAILAGELADEVSALVLNSQSAVFGIQRVLYTQGMAKRVEEYTEDITLRFFDIILNRTKLCRQEILGIHSGLFGNGISIEGYYLCGLLIFFLLLSGIIGSPLFAHRRRELGSLMVSRGIGAAAQVSAEYLAYAGMNLLYMTQIVLLLWILRETGKFEIDEWEYLGAEALTGFWHLLVPVSLMLSALQFLVYELVSGMVNSILLQFLSSIVMGYLAGCFYPYTFFPDILQKIGMCLPVGTALRFVQGGVAGDIPALAGCGIAAYLALFLGLSVAARRLRAGRGQ